MIKVKHPQEHRNQGQEEILATNSTPAHRRFHELAFSYRNATYRYFHGTENLPATEQDFEEWLGLLHPAIAQLMNSQGFEVCRKDPDFARFMEWKRDLGLDAYVRGLMGPEDHNEYISHIHGREAK